MSKNTTKLAKTLRNRFAFGTHDLTRYFPGHMAKGMRQIQNKLIDVDCIVEVHDARIPISGRNPAFRDHVLVRPHILVLNKMDLTELKHKDRIIDYYEKKQGIAKVLFANCRDQVHHTIKKQILPNVINIIGANPRYNRENSEDFNLLIIGIPNVGKSSLINAIRRTHLKKGKATRVGPAAGVTTSLLTKIKVCDYPPVFVLDTPGILQPTIEDVETGMKLAVCANLKDHLVGEMMIADFILYWLNKHNKLSYAEYFNLEEPTDDILEVLASIAKRDDLFIRMKAISRNGFEVRPDFNLASKKFIKAFRDGQLGKVNLDEDFTSTMYSGDSVT